MKKLNDVGEICLKKLLLTTLLLFMMCTACSIDKGESRSTRAEEQKVEQQVNMIATTEQGKQQDKENIVSLEKAQTKILDMHRIDVPAMSQYPEYINGCEITSLAMLTGYINLPYDREDLINLLAIDTTPVVKDSNGTIIEWGDPNLGFVGDITGNQIGYGVYHAPIYSVLNEVSDGNALDLTGSDFADIERQISMNRPVIVWTTSLFETVDEWVQWKTKTGETIDATFKEHAVLLVGYSEEHVYVNDPRKGTKSEQVPKQQFIESWEQLGRQAVSYSLINK